MGNALHLFTLGRIPVYANVWFALILGFLAMNQPSLGHSLGLMAAWSASLLVHEMGHALVAQRYGLQPQILLHGIGGLCFHAPIADDRKNAFIVAAGPGLEIIFGLMILGLQTVLESTSFELLWEDQGGDAYEGTAFGSMLHWTVRFSIIWGLVNLVPLHPLDGGLLFRLWMRRKKHPIDADKITHIVSIFVGVAGVMWGYTNQYWFVVLLGGMLAYNNWEALSQLSLGHPSSRTTNNEFAEVLSTDAEAAFAANDWQEAARLAHQLRDQANTPETLQARAFELIVLSNVALGRWDEAAGFLDHAPDNPAIREARQKIESGLDAEASDGW